jgi:GT2 family glycosyltransferase
MLTISIINYRNWRATNQCISDLALVCKEIECRIVVRDNSEAPETDQLRSELSNSSIPVLCFESPENPGFGEGHNQNFRAVSHAEGDVFLVLNNDIRIPDATVIRTMLAACAPQRIASCVVKTAASGDIWCSGGSIHRITGDLIGTRKSFDGAMRSAMFVSGCCLMVSSDLFERLGGFDRRLFMYSEDLDFCLRAHALGVEAVVVNAAIIHEAGSGEKGQYSNLYLYEGTKNRAICLRRHHLGIAPISSIYFVLKYGLFRSLQLATCSRDPLPQIRMAWRGIWDGLFHSQRRSAAKQESAYEDRPSSAKASTE